MVTAPHDRKHCYQINFTHLAVKLIPGLKVLYFKLQSAEHICQYECLKSILDIGFPSRSQRYDPVGRPVLQEKIACATMHYHLYRVICHSGRSTLTFGDSSSGICCVLTIIMVENDLVTGMVTTDILVWLQCSGQSQYDSSNDNISVSMGHLVMVKFMT